MSVIISFVVLFIFIVLLICGPCTIELKILYQQYNVTIILKILMWSGVYGIEIIDEKIRKRLIVVFCKKRILSHPIGGLQYKKNSKFANFQTIFENFFKNRNRQRNKILLREFKKIFKSLIMSISVTHVWIQGLFGTSDPALTGKIFGLSQILRVYNKQIMKIQLIPNFIINKFEGNFIIGFRLVLLKLILSSFWSFIGIVWTFNKYKFHIKSKEISYGH